MALFLVTGGCSWKRGPDASPIDSDLRRIDSLHEQRITRSHLEDSIRLAEQMAIEHPENPEVQWRVARGLTAMAYGYPGEDSEALLLESMEWGRRCLRGNPGWVSREQLSGGKVTRRAALRLSGVDLPCLEALLTGWTRWVVLRGAAAHVDLDSLQVLARRAVALDTEQQGWVAPWALGLSLGLSAAHAEAMEEAEGLLSLAASREPELATPRIDAVYMHRRWSEAAGTAELLDVDLPTYAAHKWALENRRAVQRELQMRDGEPSGSF
ncbi:MAG: hypothetical protein VX519_02405 [Myxococcota bacterium]|nr:hypothetical protein [Myxococcota bacterium]